MKTLPNLRWYLGSKLRDVHAHEEGSAQTGYFYGRRIRSEFRCWVHAA